MTTARRHQPSFLLRRVQKLALRGTVTLFAVLLLVVAVQYIVP